MDASATRTKLQGVPGKMVTPGGFCVSDPEVLHAMLDAMPARIALLDARRRYGFANAAYARAVEVPQAEIPGRSATQVIGATRARRMLPLARAALEGRTTQIQSWSKYPIAGWDYVETLYAPVRRPDGRIDGYFVMVRDLTPLKRREEELAARTAHLEAIISSVADGVSIADAEGRMILCNQGFLEMFDCPPEFARPGTPHDAFIRHRLALNILYPHEATTDPPDHMADRQTARLRAAGGLMRETLAIGGRRLNIRRRQMPDGTFVSTYTDVTAQVEAEVARRLQYAAMLEAQRLGTIAVLLGGVAHELKNPLSVVAAHAALLEEESAGTALAARAEAVQAAVRQCGRIVDSLLASVRHRARKRKEVRLQDALAAAQGLVAHRLLAAGATIETRLPADLPCLRADPDQLVHLWANLLGNAAAALENHAGGPPRILVTAATEDGSLVVEVADNGPGIPPALRKRVFQPFFTTKAKGAGSGIGLALCLTIVQEHGGSIAARDTPGGGATLVVRLPLPPASAPKRK